MASGWARARTALRDVFSIEGLVTLIVDGAVWAIGTALLIQLTDFRLGPSLAMGAGIGALGAATFLWTVVRPSRARERERMAILRNSVRDHLRGIIREGDLWTGAGLAPDFARLRSEWQAKAHSFLTAAFGPAEADRVMAGTSVRQQLARLEELFRNVDETPLHPDYRGWKG